MRQRTRIVCRVWWNRGRRDVRRHPLPRRIELAKEKTRPNLAFEVGDANDLSMLAQSSFDVVVLNAVFHWLPEKTGPLCVGYENSGATRFGRSLANQFTGPFVILKPAYVRVKVSLRMTAA